MRYEVLLTPGAENDLAEIHDYIAVADSAASAEYVLERVLQTGESLATFPERGSIPRELVTLGIREYRQVFFKPYRLIYRIEGRQVQVHIIADGRRDMKSLLARRLLG